MNSKITESSTVSLSVSTWSKLIAMVATVIATFFGMFLSSQQTMHDLDIKWQDRIAILSASIRSDIRSVEEKIPPDWFRRMVERNQTEIQNLEDDLEAFTKDFVRKDEMPSLIK